MWWGDTVQYSTVVIRLEDHHPPLISKNVLKNHRGIFYLEIPFFSDPNTRPPSLSPLWQDM